MTTAPKNGYLPRKTFFWFMGILVMVIVAVNGYMVGKQDKLAETFNHSLSEVVKDVSEIKSDVSFIRGKLDL